MSDFTFYVLCEQPQETQETGKLFGQSYLFVGYFSRYNERRDGPDAQQHEPLSCYFVRSEYQRRGYGTLLVSVSYYLSARDSKWGSPERPLSPAGRANYECYWLCVLYRFLLHAPLRYGTPFASTFTVQDIIHGTGIDPEDVIPLYRDSGLVTGTGGGYEQCAEGDNGQLTVDEVALCSRRNELEFKLKKHTESCCDVACFLL